MLYTIAAQPVPAWVFAVVIFAALIGLSVGIMVQVCLYWLVSKFIMPDTGTLHNAFRYLGYRLLLGIAMIAVVVGFGRLALPFIDLKSSNIHMFTLVAILAMGVVLIVFVLKIAMHVYEVSFLKALEFEVVLIIIGGCLTAANFLFLPHFKTTVTMTPAERQKQQEVKQQVLGILFGKKDTGPISTLDSSSATMRVELPAPDPAGPPAAQSPLPPETTLIEPVQITIALDGTTTGSVTLPRGTRLKLISEQGDEVRVHYLQTVATIPRKSTALPPGPQ